MGTSVRVVDKASLEFFLRQGLSLGQIGKRVGKDGSTVGYWVRKHGLEAVHRERCAPRGGLERDQIEPLVEADCSTREIAAALAVSQGTVRHWLRVYGLKARGRPGIKKTRGARAEGLAIIQLECRHHGLTDFFLEGRGYYRCKRCRSEAVARRRRKVKQILVAEAGGRCALCG